MYRLAAITDILEPTLFCPMAKGSAYAVFVVPVVFTVVFSTAVLAGALDTMDRELNMWPSGGHGSSPAGGEIVISGLYNEYDQFDTIEFHAIVSEPRYDCGTLFVRMYNSIGDLAEERIYESQCFAAESLPLPLEGFSTTVGAPGSYTVTVTMSAGEDQLLASAVFTVR